MSDARSLLRAKRQEVRINHPLASYSAAGQLRCIACGINIKQGTSWEGHVGSKQHRTNAARLKEEEQRRAQEEALRQKRKAEEEQYDEEDEGIEAKRRRVGSSADEDDEDDEQQPAPSAAKGGFPADFFSDPSRAPPSEDTDEEDASGARPAPAAPATKNAMDEEWERFQASVVNAPDVHEAYERATVFAEPVLAPEVPEGFPPQAADNAQDEQNTVLDEAEIRRRKEQDERELIMDRLWEEERVQEEADAKVSLLKSRLEAVKRQREARKAMKGKSGQT